MSTLTILQSIIVSSLICLNRIDVQKVLAAAANKAIVRITNLSQENQLTRDLDHFARRLELLADQELLNQLSLHLDVALLVLEE